jgi:hypothetical protein
MSAKLICRVLGGVVIAAFGVIAGHTPIGFAICIAAGAIAAYVWERVEGRRKLQGNE